MASKHQLTRAQMEELIQSGQGVIHGGVVYTSVAQLPSEAELAAGDPEAEAKVASTLQAQIDELQASLAKLTAEKPATATGKGKKGADAGGTTPPVDPPTPPADPNANPDGDGKK